MLCAASVDEKNDDTEIRERPLHLTLHIRCIPRSYCVLQVYHSLVETQHERTSSIRKQYTNVDIDGTLHIFSCMIALVLIVLCSTAEVSFDLDCHSTTLLCTRDIFCMIASFVRSHRGNALDRTKVYELML